MDHLACQLEAWNRKPGLRAVYGLWFEEMRQWLTDGVTFEIGCGIGRLKEHIEKVIAVDILTSPWAEIVADGEALPMREGCASNLVLFDVLHHLPRPVVFFREALRVLRIGGRLIISDPYVSPLSGLVYRHFHPEPVEFRCNPLEEEATLSSCEPFDSNQAIATILFQRNFRDWRVEFPEFRVITLKRFAFFAYPATGGFGFRSFLPAGVVGWIQKKERLLSPLSSLLAFRILVVLEKRP